MTAGERPDGAAGEWSEDALLLLHTRLCYGCWREFKHPYSGVLVGNVLDMFKRLL